MKRYTDKEKEWLKTNYSILGSRKCAEHLGRSKPSICQMAARLGCSIPQSLRNKIHSQTLIRKFMPSILPDTFIRVKTKETAYVMGILWADGWIQNKNDYSVNIKLVEEDFIEILPIFYKLGEWKQYKYFPKNRKPTIQLRLSGKSIVDIFSKLGYENKSHISANTVIDTIPTDLIPYWWRGYMDGDGHITSKHPYRLEFASAWNQDWSFLPKDIPFKISITRGKHSYSKATLTSKKEIIRFGNMIWSNLDKIGLSRKYGKYRELLQSVK